jgi:hypothetical protein
VPLVPRTREVVGEGVVDDDESRRFHDAGNWCAALMEAPGGSRIARSRRVWWCLVFEAVRVLRLAGKFGSLGTGNLESLEA